MLDECIEYEGSALRTGRQALLQLLRLLWVVYRESVQIPRTSNFEFGLCLPASDLGRDLFYPRLCKRVGERVYASRNIVVDVREASFLWVILMNSLMSRISLGCLGVVRGAWGGLGTVVSSPSCSLDGVDFLFVAVLGLE